MGTENPNSTTPTHGSQCSAGAVRQPPPSPPPRPYLADLPLFAIHRDGETYDPAQDCVRLNAQMARVWLAMRDGTWRTLDEIATMTADPPASVSARLRDFRKQANGSHRVERQRIRYGSGTYQYRLIPNPQKVMQYEETTDGGRAES